MSTDIRVYKLETGEEIISRVEPGKSEGTTLLIKPRIVVIGQHPKTQQLMNQLLPFLAADPDGNMEIQNTSLAGELTSPIPDQLERSYLEHTSGIELA